MRRIFGGVSRLEITPSVVKHGTLIDPNIGAIAIGNRVKRPTPIDRIRRLFGLGLATLEQPRTSFRIHLRRAIGMLLKRAIGILLKRAIGMHLGRAINPVSFQGEIIGFDRPGIVLQLLENSAVVKPSRRRIAADFECPLFVNRRLDGDAFGTQGPNRPPSGFQVASEMPQNRRLVIEGVAISIPRPIKISLGNRC